MSYLLNLSHPVPNGVERFFVCDVVHQEDSLCASEVGRRDGAETLLPGRIPNLQLDSLGIAFMYVATFLHRRRMSSQGIVVIVVLDPHGLSDSEGETGDGGVTGRRRDMI